MKQYIYQYFLSVMKGTRTDFIAQVISYLLVPWSLFYRVGLFFHRLFCRIKGVYKAPKPVISVGNITVGGAGKTPLVIWLARSLQDKGLKSIILIRGYMPKASQVSDEVDMINEQIPYIPVLAGKNRIANIKEAEDVMPVDLYICDDAFQHWPLFRDLNIVAIDSSNPFGNGFLLPAGILREPVSSLKRADVFILTKIHDDSDTVELTAHLRKINPKALILESRYQAIGVVDVFDPEFLPENFLNNQPVIGFCAIGDPASFESSLENSGAKISKIFTYLDHHVYQRDDIKRMLDLCKSHGIQVLVTTHKDAVKLKNFRDMFAGFKLIYIPIQLEITKGSDELFHKIISLCHR